MHSANHWGGSFDVQLMPPAEDEQSSNMEFDRAALMPRHLNETQQGWLLAPVSHNRKERYVDLGCIMCKRKLFKWAIYAFLIGFVVVGIPIIVVKTLPKHKVSPPPPDQYTVALRMALKFFNAQKSGRLPRNNGISWRGDSGQLDGSRNSDLKHGLIGGYYDSGNNIKFHFPMAFSMTLLTWSVIEYGNKYEATGEYYHARDIIKWGADYLLLTFNSSASSISKIYSQVGRAENGSKVPDDEFCWQRPEDMTYDRPVQISTGAPDLGSEVASALAAASILFRDDDAYSKKLVKAAATAYEFAVQTSVGGNPLITEFYNSTGYWDEIIWGAAWMYYATGNYTYLDIATRPDLVQNARKTLKDPDSNVFSWDNKIPGAQLLLSRIRIFLNPGYPYEEMLGDYHKKVGISMCSYLRQFGVFNWTKGGLIQLNHGQPRPLQYVVNAAFLANLFADYMNASHVPGWFCGPNYFTSDALRSFAASQVNYVLGANPRNMSYVVGYGEHYPTHVRHRGASIPSRHVVSCTGGWKWRDVKVPNPNVITGAMVGGPDRNDKFMDVRWSRNHNEPTLAGNAGLVAALVSLTSSGSGGIDKNTMFSSVMPLLSSATSPPPPWTP